MFCFHISKYARWNHFYTFGAHYLCSKTMKTRQKKNSFEEKIEKKFCVSRFPPKPIPKHVLTRTLKIANDPEDEFWLNKNYSCTIPISNESQVYSDSHKKLNIARKCLLTRDWYNLAKLLTSQIVGITDVQRSSFETFSKYASILLTLEDPELLQKLHQTITQKS